MGLECLLSYFLSCTDDATHVTVKSTTVFRLWVVYEVEMTSEAAEKRHIAPLYIDITFMTQLAVYIHPHHTQT